MNDLTQTFTLSDITQQFRAAMAEQQINYKGEIEADGKLHRFYVEDDTRGSLNGFYCLHYDEKPAGIFGCNKRYGFDKKFQWQSNQKTAAWTDEERLAYKERVAKERAEKDAAEKKRHAKAAFLANALWNASAVADDSHPYLVAKGVKAHGLRLGEWRKPDHDTGQMRLISDQALLVPICDRTRAIYSLQAIFPSKLKSMGGRNKDYFIDGAKRGLFHTIGKPLMHEGRLVFVLCEGYATGASIHECTGHLVLVCFDAGNLLPVAQAINSRMLEQGKDVLIIIAADNDRWTLKPVENPGVYHGKETAKAVKGRIAIPDFHDLSGEPTDFNDLHQIEGAAAVKAFFDDVLNPPSAEEGGIEFDDDILSPPDVVEPSQEPQGPTNDDEEFEDELIKNAYFTLLGYDGPTYYLFHHEKRQVMDISKADLSDAGLIELAPINWWEEHFPGEKGINKKQAANWLFRQCNARGIYDPTRIRGRGAWKDKDRYVFHHGDRLTVDGVPTDITRIASAYVYPMARKMPEPAEVMLTAEEGKHLLEVAKMIRWTKPASAPLLAGWVMLAPICGALKWRPHIWLTGAAGSGKSTIQQAFCCSLTNGINVYAQGNSTEPGIRQELKADAMPVLLDEAESSDDKERARMESILALIRQSSSESQAKTLKGTVSGSSMRFSVRSMFCLASINTNLDKKADVDRLTKLVIKAPMMDGSSEEHWKILSDELHKISTDETISNRLLARALNMLPIILKNVEVFTRVGAKCFGSQREGDQFGTMMAGAWSLCSDNVVTDELAEVMISRYEWGEHIEDHDQDDASRALDELMGAKIRMAAGFGDLSVFELVREVAGPLYQTGVVPAKEADAALKRHGIRVELASNELLFGTSVANLKKLVQGSNYVTDLRGQLLRLPDATRYNDKAMRFNGRASKCVAIKLDVLLDGEMKDDDEPPI